MRCYIILAHPEKNSFNTSLAKKFESSFSSLGHEVRFKDLYEKKFNPLLSRNDYPQCKDYDHVQFPKAQLESFELNNISQEIYEEHQNLLWAELVIIQFPMWLYGMPAILKGWCERVLTEGFAHQPSKDKWFEKGGLAGTRLLLSITMNGKMESFTKRGRHGKIEIILWPIMNAFWFSGFEIVKPFLSFNVVKQSDEYRNTILEHAAEYALSAKNESLIKIHPLNDYDKAGILKAEVKPKTPAQLTSSDNFDFLQSNKFRN